MVHMYLCMCAVSCINRLRSVVVTVDPYPIYPLRIVSIHYYDERDADTQMSESRHTCPLVHVRYYPFTREDARTMIQNPGALRVPLYHCFFFFFPFFLSFLVYAFVVLVVTSQVRRVQSSDFRSHDIPDQCDDGDMSGNTGTRGKKGRLLPSPSFCRRKQLADRHCTRR
jgi:hypothetical protein